MLLSPLGLMVGSYNDTPFMSLPLVSFQGSKLPMLQSPLGVMVGSYNDSPFTSPPPAHMGIPPITIDPKTGKLLPYNEAAFPHPSCTLRELCITLGQMILSMGPCQANLVLIAYASSACASVQSRQNLHCSLIQAVSQEEPSDRKPDPWPL